MILHRAYALLYANVSEHSIDAVLDQVDALRVLVRQEIDLNTQLRLVVGQVDLLPEGNLISDLLDFVESRARFSIGEDGQPHLVAVLDRLIDGGECLLQSGGQVRSAALHGPGCDRHRIFCMATPDLSRLLRKEQDFELSIAVAADPNPLMHKPDFDRRHQLLFALHRTALVNEADDELIVLPNLFRRFVFTDDLAVFEKELLVHVPVLAVWDTFDIRGLGDGVVCPDSADYSVLLTASLVAHALELDGMLFILPLLIACAFSEERLVALDKDPTALERSNVQRRFSQHILDCQVARLFARVHHLDPVFQSSDPRQEAGDLIAVVQLEL